MIQRYFCWQCDTEKQLHEGKISKSKRVFTCYNCLKKYESSTHALWKKQKQENESKLLKIPFSQMSLFESVDTLNSVF